MGCWNKTCALTQLPIHDKDPVVTFLIVENYYARKNQSSACNSHTFWEIIPLPLYGKYDDYGWMEADKGQDWKLKMLAKTLGVAHKSGKTGNPFKTFGTMNEELFRGDGWGVRNAGLRVSHIMIHADTFNELTNEITFGYTQGKVTKESLMRDFEDFKKVMQAYKDDDAIMERFQKEHREAGEELTRQALEAITRQFRRITDMGCGVYADIQDFVKTNYPDQSHYESPSSGMLTMYWNDGMAVEGMAYNTREFVKATRDTMPTKEAVDGYLVMYLYDILRKQIHPMGHEGSQDGFNPIHTQYAKSYLQRIEDYNKKYGE